MCVCMRSMQSSGDAQGPGGGSAGEAGFCDAGSRISVPLVSPERPVCHSPCPVLTLSWSSRCRGKGTLGAALDVAGETVHAHTCAPLRAQGTRSLALTPCHLGGGALWGTSNAPGPPHSNCVCSSGVLELFLWKLDAPQSPSSVGDPTSAFSGGPGTPAARGSSQFTAASRASESAHPLPDAWVGDASRARVCVTASHRPLGGPRVGAGGRDFVVGGGDKTQGGPRPPGGWWYALRRSARLNVPPVTLPAVWQRECRCICVADMGTRAGTPRFFRNGNLIENLKS